MALWILWDCELKPVGGFFLSWQDQDYKTLL